MTVFGTLPDGTPIQQLTLEAGTTSVHLLALGARLNAVHIDDSPNLTVGVRDVEDALGSGKYAGPVIGPVINRLGHSKAVLDGSALSFPPNQDGRHLLHSGDAGTQFLNWQIVEASGELAVLQALLPDGAGGFPGERKLTATWRVKPSVVELDILAETDRPTLLNVGHHGYWNLDGTPRWEGHELTVSASRYTPTDADTVPTGDVRDVAGTIFDLREMSAPSALLDTNLCLDEGAGPAARLQGRSGRWMEVWTDAPGLQVYSGKETAIALEPQIWPDAPNHKGFPTIRFTPETPFRQSTRYVFGQN